MKTVFFLSLLLIVACREIPESMMVAPIEDTIIIQPSPVAEPIPIPPGTIRVYLSAVGLTVFRVESIVARGADCPNLNQFDFFEAVMPALPIGIFLADITQIYNIGGGVTYEIHPL